MKTIKVLGLADAILEYEKQGKTWFDYDRQAWVVDGKYVRCAHPQSMKCNCYGRIYAGQEAKR